MASPSGLGNRFTNKDYGELKKWSDNVTALLCQNFSIHVPVDGLIEIEAQFIISAGGSCSADEIAGVVQRVTYHLCSGKIDLVKATDQPRCFYCGSLGEREDAKCGQCGGTF